MTKKSMFWCVASLAVLFLAAGCTKSDPLQDQLNNLSDTWEIESISGGFSGQGYQPSFKTLRIKASNFYQLVKANESVFSEGTFALQSTDASDLDITFTRQGPKTESLSGFEGQTKRVTLSNDTLVLTDPCCDLYEYRFIRK